MPHPVVFDVEYPQSHSRWLIFVKLLLAIPHYIVIYLLVIPLSILTFLAWFAILFTGRYPRAFFDFNTGILRWMANVGSYVFLLRDEYPPFSWESGDYPLILEIPYAERQSRFRLFIRIFAIIPNQIVLGIVQFGWYLTTFLAWWAILFTGHYPKGLFRFSIGVGRWYFRQSAYLYLLRDEYPPYSVNSEARPGNEVVSAVIGFPLFALYVTSQTFFVSSTVAGDETSTVLAPAVIRSDEPSVRAGGVRITLLDYRGDGVVHQFTVRAEKDGWHPAFYTPAFFSLETCGLRRTYSPESVEGDSFEFFVADGSAESQVTFFTDGELICGLNYLGGSFEFEH